jgi:hypothetical protein
MIHSPKRILSRSERATFDNPNSMSENGQSLAVQPV